MIKFRREKDVDKNKIFIPISQFKKSELIINEDILEENAAITGIRMSGKTEKVLVPSFSMCKHGGLYIDFKSESEDEVRKIAEDNGRTLHVFYNDTLNVEKVIDQLRDNHLVYFNVRFGKKNDIESLDRILFELYRHRNKLDTTLNIFIDNIQYFNKLENLERIICDESKLKVMITLNYLRQLESVYGEESVKNIKENMIVYDVEKQY